MREIINILGWFGVGGNNLEATGEILQPQPQVKTVLGHFTEFVHSATGGEGVVMLGRNYQI